MQVQLALDQFGVYVLERLVSFKNRDMIFVHGVVVYLEFSSYVPLHLFLHCDLLHLWLLDS